MMIRTIIVVLALVLTCPVYAAQYTATVDHVRDGDTIEVTTTTGQSLVIRLSRIQCAELKTHKGKQLKQLVTDILLHKQVVLHTNGIGYYGRTLAEVYYLNTSINQYLLDRGYCPLY
jgi:endonuclease YncB( thermonuclease family)